MTVTADDGTLLSKDPGSTQTYTFDWNDNLGTSVLISTQTTSSVALRPSTTDTALLVTSSGSGLGIQAGSRSVKIQLAAGTAHQTYRITNRVTTNETPAQIKERSFDVRVENQ